MRSKTLALIAVVLGFVVAAGASVPEWMRQVARQPVPAYKADVNGVVLLDEEITTVDKTGETHTVYRRAVKILRPVARESLSRVYVPFDNDTRITWMKGWSITPSGQEYELKEKDAVEVGAAYSAFMADSRIKVLMVPGAEVGSVIGYEYQQQRRASANQDVWVFQESLPVRLCRYTLRLPDEWTYQSFFNNHDRIEPKQSGNEYTWEVADVPELEEEDYMPPTRAIAGRMVLHYFYPRPGVQAANTASWQSVASWYWMLTQDRLTATPELKQKVVELTANSKTPLEKIEAVSRWVQKEIRYVDIEIGVGGFQPHRAGEVFQNRFGDCKDKAVLLATMLNEIGVESEYVLIDFNRGVVRPDTPAVMTFNHAMLAIRLPKDTPTGKLNAIYKDDKLGNLLLFDPTNEPPFGDLPATLQQTPALMIHNGEGKMIQTPLFMPETNRLQRTGTFKIGPDGRLTADMTEVRTGAVGTDTRAQLLHAEKSNRAKTIEAILSNNIGSFQLTSATVADLEDWSAPLILKYSFTAQEYAKKSGPLMLVRPRVVGRKTWSIMEGKKRIYPVEFEYASQDNDLFEIEIPAGYEVDELPDPVDIDYDFGAYHSKVEQVAGSLKFSRIFVIKQVIIPTDRLEDLKKFYRQIAGDERSTVVLKQKATP